MDTRLVGAVDAAEQARELEADLKEFPEEQGEILTEAAQCWHQAGESDRAIEQLTEVIGLGGEDGAIARVALADVLFDLGRDEEADAQLDRLRHAPSPSPLPDGRRAAGGTQGLRAGADLVHRGRVPAERGGGQPPGRIRAFTYANMVLAGRRRVRRALGMPADEWDRTVVDASRDLPTDDSAMLTDAEVMRRLAQAPRPDLVQILFWPREEIAEAHQRWPELVHHADADSILRDREAANRRLSEAGAAQIMMVPLTVAKLAEYAARTGSDPLQEQARNACLDEIVHDGGTISWPPQRNAACWCGSGTKYKKCCGRPDLR